MARRSRRFDSERRRAAKGKRGCGARRSFPHHAALGRHLTVIARASSYCRSRQAVLRLRETRPRHRAGRKPARGKRRVDGGLAKSGTPRARKRPGRTGRRENGSFGAWAILNHVNAHVSEEGPQAARASARKELRASDGGRYLGPKKRTSFTGPPRNRSWRPSSSRIAFAERGSTSGRAEEATGMPAALAHEQPSGAQRRARLNRHGSAVRIAS